VWAPADRTAILNTIFGSDPVGGISDRKQEIRRRRHRKKKLASFARKLKKASAAERGVIAEKIRNLTPGADVILERWGLTDA
jgi:hypothetical protein